MDRNNFVKYWNIMETLLVLLNINHILNYWCIILFHTISHIFFFSISKMPSFGTITKIIMDVQYLKVHFFAYCPFICQASFKDTWLFFYWFPPTETQAFRPVAWKAMLC